MKKLLIIVVLLVVGTRIFAQEREIFLADPTIYVENGKYYLVGTKNRPPLGFSILESKDLKNWTVPGGSTDSLFMILNKGDHTFGDKGFWAPQIFKEGSTYYLTHTANEQTVLTESQSLKGPFRQEKVGPIDGSEKNIDSFIYQDEDGQHYLYHVRFNNGNYLWVAKFDMETGTIDPSTLKQCFGQTEDWEATPNYESAPIMEGPTVIKLKSKYYLFYSANHFMNIDYAVGYATADSPMGPWTKYEGSPIIHRSIVGENGSGHGDLFTGLDDQLYYVYHVHNSKDQVSPRRTRIVPVNMKWNKKTGVYDFSVKANKVIVPVQVTK
ncbi:glycoside hydrolase family 43 protein [Marinoscillum pacificum]|uniref:glycoside hydrolase family 43 protein n=1 Tax=Marinoscillum pacificum TaxID=392723 RepID=UPI00215813DC|nr:glycoside hydrolase family 43 protein [Marinoscillum pacificum]